VTKQIILKAKHGITGHWTTLEKTIVHYECKDCGMVHHKDNGLRPNNKFCCPDCMRYVELFNLQAQSRRKIESK
jgi:hypothetical protein